MRSLSYYGYWKFHFDYLKASSFRLEKPMGGSPLDVPGLNVVRVRWCINIPNHIFGSIALERKWAHMWKEKKIADPDGIRTHDFRSRSPLLHYKLCYKAAGSGCSMPVNLGLIPGMSRLCSATFEQLLAFWETFFSTSNFEQLLLF